MIENPGKYVSNARNLALQHIGDEITHCLEIIGHSWVDKDHLEKRVKDLIELESTTGSRIGAIGCLTRSGGDVGMVSNWIEGAIFLLQLVREGASSNNSRQRRTKVPAFCLHNVESLRSVGGWDERFITSQDSDLSMRLIKNGWSCGAQMFHAFTCTRGQRLGKWWKMCHRYGFWRTKVVLRHPKRLDLRETLPLFGLALIFILPQWWIAPLAYGIVILLVGANHSSLPRKVLTPIYGVPICLIILHTAFTLGLFDGLVRSGRPPSDRT